MPRGGTVSIQHPHRTPGEGQGQGWGQGPWEGQGQGQRWGVLGPHHHRHEGLRLQRNNSQNNELFSDTATGAFRCDN